MSKPSNLRIEDVAASTARADLNDILISIASLQTTDGSGAAYTGEPTSTYPNMLWYDKATSILKMRATADDAWINVAYVDQAADAYRIIDNTQVVDTSGTQTGILGDQSTSTWQSGIGTTESLVSPAKISAAIQALAAGGIGDGQTWQLPSRSAGVSYQNTTGNPIQVAITYHSVNNDNAPAYTFQVSQNNSTWVTISRQGERWTNHSHFAIVPNGYYYKQSGWNNSGGGSIIWAELR